MPVIIDGYNLFYFAQSVYAETEQLISLPAFGTILGEWARRTRQKGTIVFDGNPPPQLGKHQKSFGNLLIRFSGKERSADDVIKDYILHSTAPKLLTVVSTDREIRKAAQKRSCIVCKSDEFWSDLAKRLSQKTKHPEPHAKTAGLIKGSSDSWLKYFGM
jgi:predicted RNA-binding protein with PIN domain